MIAVDIEMVSIDVLRARTAGLSEVYASEAASRTEAILFVSECGADMFRRCWGGSREDLKTDCLPRREHFIMIQESVCENTL